MSGSGKSYGENEESADEAPRLSRVGGARRTARISCEVFREGPSEKGMWWSGSVPIWDPWRPGKWSSKHIPPPLSSPCFSELSTHLSWASPRKRPTYPFPWECHFYTVSRKPEGIHLVQVGASGILQFISTIECVLIILLYTKSPQRRNHCT